MGAVAEGGIEEEIGQDEEGPCGDNEEEGRLTWGCWGGGVG